MYNIATLWNEQLPEGEEDPVQDTGDNAEEEDQDVEINYALSDVQIRRIGQAERDEMLRDFIH